MATDDGNEADDGTQEHATDQPGLTRSVPPPKLGPKRGGGDALTTVPHARIQPLLALLGDRAMPLQRRIRRGEILLGGLPKRGLAPEP